MNNKTNNSLEKYIFDKKENLYFLDFRSDLEQDRDPDSLFHNTDPRVQMKRIRNTDS